MKKRKLWTILSGIGLVSATVPAATTSCNAGPQKTEFEYPEDNIDSEMGVDSIPGPVQPEEDIDTDMQVPDFGPVQPEEDIDTDMQVPAFGPVQPDFDIDTEMGVDSIPGPVQPEEDIDTEMGVDSIPGPVQPEEDIDTDMQVPAFGPVQPDFDIDTDMQVPAFGPVQPDFDIDTEMGVDSIPGPVQPEEDSDTDMNVDINNTPIINMTYEELRLLRSVNNLVPGQQYRITDYTASTSQTEWSKATKNRFDIIVTALTNNVLSEDAKAIQNEKDSYFDNNNLAAWNIKYCFDNNTDRFSWATSDGKGVIYYMKDEFGNEAPYDFKNLMFKPYYDATRSKTKYDQNIFVYTFASAYSVNNKDLSLSAANHIYWNSLGNKETFNLPRIVFFGSENYNNVFENGCTKITFGASLNTLKDGIQYFRGNNYGNTFGQYCEQMTFEGSSYSNVFGQKNINNVFGLTCFYNTFGAYNWGSTFGNNFVANSFGNHNYRNKFGNNNWSNSFGNDCRDNTFGNDCNYNYLGNNCYNNKIGNNCLGNFFAINCVNVTLKDNTHNQKINV